MLDEKYIFYQLTPKEHTSIKDFIDTHFRELLGKIFRPTLQDERLILALEKKATKEETKEGLKRETWESLDTKFIIEKFSIEDK